VNYLLDTAVWINGVIVPSVLPPRIRRLLHTEAEKALASVSLLETAILYRVGRLELDATLPEFFEAALAADVRLIELSPAIAAKTNDLPSDFQGDPFDRTIAATAAVLSLTLITTDPAIRDANICSVEYYPFKRLRWRRRTTTRKS
jgi:PIN domain nuclease of toxin-antitoxin system